MNFSISIKKQTKLNYSKIKSSLCYNLIICYNFYVLQLYELKKKKNAENFQNCDWLMCTSLIHALVTDYSLEINIKQSITLIVKPIPLYFESEWVYCVFRWRFMCFHLGVECCGFRFNDVKYSVTEKRFKRFKYTKLHNAWWRNYTRVLPHKYFQRC